MNDDLIGVEGVDYVMRKYPLTWAQLWWQWGGMILPFLIGGLIVLLGQNMMVGAIFGNMAALAITWFMRNRWSYDPPVNQAFFGAVYGLFITLVIGVIIGVLQLSQ
ncbi:MAG: hypothetical protein ACKVOE_00420 [Rickettsiales bacterium]